MNRALSASARSSPKLGPLKITGTLSGSILRCSFSGSRLVITAMGILRVAGMATRAAARLSPSNSSIMAEMMTRSGKVRTIRGKASKVVVTVLVR